MAWASLVITLLAHCTGGISQAIVIQASSLTTSPGGTVTLTCGSSTGAVTTNNYANWVQEKPNQVHTDMIAATSRRATGVPARFSGSLLGDKAALTITGAQPEDEGIYYCALWNVTISQAAVIQESSLTTSPGGTVTFTCASRTGAVTTSNYANWVQEKSHQVHTGLIGGTTYRAPDVPARFSGSLIGDKAALTITGAQPEDEAIYYCALWYSDQFHSDTHRWGSETQSPCCRLITAVFLPYGYISLGSEYMFSIIVEKVIRLLCEATNCLFQYIL
ncbi:uncharacterized protein LOC113835357 isoform X1 [Cricetulus griseus]|uniref:uncharacterized protein LOC113835357 isoform X1 n=1 Tax=Cricetulus griseus TaxID=10029 RepID=UPI000F74915E|nr:uncharacterized protein LOC113835357 isoform X1 [Cricetulus griseus]